MFSQIHEIVTMTKEIPPPKILPIRLKLVISNFFPAFDAFLSRFCLTLPVPVCSRYVYMVIMTLE